MEQLRHRENRNPDSEYLKEVPEHLRHMKDCVAYWQTDNIGNVHPDELAQVEAPLFDRDGDATRYGKNFYK
ncbi:hypothetical protein DORFOR_02160, partial [Dorea formicigenerans ATCC 27755]